MLRDLGSRIFGQSEITSDEKPQDIEFEAKEIDFDSVLHKVWMTGRRMDIDKPHKMSLRAHTLKFFHCGEGEFRDSSLKIVFKKFAKVSESSGVVEFR